MMTDECYKINDTSGIIFVRVNRKRVFYTAVYDNYGILSILSLYYY